MNIKNPFEGRINQLVSQHRNNPMTTAEAELLGVQAVDYGACLDPEQVGWPTAEDHFAPFLGPLTEVSAGWPADECRQPIELEENKVIDLRDPADFAEVLPRPRTSLSIS